MRLFDYPARKAAQNGSPFLLIQLRG